MADVGEIGRRIRAYRRRRGLSQERLAHLVGRSESWLSQVERGIRSVENLAVLTRLAQVLDVPWTCWPANLCRGPRGPGGRATRSPRFATP